MFTDLPIGIAFLQDICQVQMRLVAPHTSVFYSLCCYVKTLFISDSMVTTLVVDFK